MLSRLAATLRERQGLGAAAPTLGGAVGEGGTIVLNEDCHVSFALGALAGFRGLLCSIGDVTMASWFTGAWSFEFGAIARIKADTINPIITLFYVYIQWIKLSYSCYPIGCKAYSSVFISTVATRVSNSASHDAS